MAEADRQVDRYRKTGKGGRQTDKANRHAEAGQDMTESAGRDGDIFSDYQESR